MAFFVPTEREIADLVNTFPKPSFSLRKGERIFEELREEIRTQHPEDGIAVIDTKNKEWRYAPCIADAERLAAEMKNPGRVYYRPCYRAYVN